MNRFQDYKKKLVCCLLLLLWIYAPSSLAQRSLNVPLVVQEEVFWCWAASSAAVMGYYYGAPVESQCKIADWARQQGDWGADDCCANPGGETCNRTNKLCFGNESIRSILNNWHIAGECVFDWEEVDPPMTEADIQAQIDANKPFIIRTQYFGGHFVVGHGYDFDPTDDSLLVHYMDPWVGRGFTVARYDWLVENQGWNIALVLNTDPWPLRKVALPGDVTPDGSTIAEVSGHIYGLVKGFDLNDAGNVVYIAKLEGNGQGIYTHAGEVIAKKGAQAPGGGQFASFYSEGDFRSVSINNNDEIVFLADLDNGKTGIFTRATRIVQQDDPAPEGGTFIAFGGSDINDAGQVAFFAHTRDEGGTSHGIYLWDETGIHLVTRAGVIMGIPTLRDNGTVVYLGGLQNQGIVASDGQVFALAGAAAPGGGTYATGIAQFNYPDANASAAAEAVFLAGLESGAEGVFTSGQRIAVTGEAAPDGGEFVDLIGRPSINDAGLVVYLGRTSNGLLAIFDSTSKIVVAAGETAFADYTLLDLADPVLNNVGQTALYGRISNNAVTQEGIFVTILH
jgi:peptidase C39-like protein